MKAYKFGHIQFMSKTVTLNPAKCDSGFLMECFGNINGNVVEDSDELTRQFEQCVK